MKELNIGLFGFGTVGEGIYKVLNEKKQLGATVKKICIKDPDKVRNAPDTLFTTQKDELLNDPEIDLIVELIDDANAALEIIETSFRNGKSVISANKKVIAENLVSLIELSKQHKVSFLYEAAVCASIPIIRNLEEYFDNDLLDSVNGIVNGSTNYILTKMQEDDKSYSDALSEAQELGFAESDPSLDVEGVDAAYKLSIITLHAFGKHIAAENIVRKGISALSQFDFQYAKEKNFAIKLIALSKAGNDGTIEQLSVLPRFVEKSSALHNINNEYNGLLLQTALADEQFFYGKGAGRYPTSSAVLSDISAFKYDYQYAYKKGFDVTEKDNELNYNVYISYKPDYALDPDIFEVIHEQYYNQDRCYICGEISYHELESNGLLEDKNYSLICFN